MRFLSGLFLFLSVWASSAFASAHIVFEREYTVWQNGEMLLWSVGSQLPVSPQEFCMALIRQNERIGNPSCRDAGEWHRDTVSQRYGAWLAQNAAKNLGPEHLKARGSEMSQKLQNLGEQTLVFLFARGDSLWFALFDSQANEPELLGYLTDLQNESANADALAGAMFGKRAQRRLSPGEKENLAKKPDAYFAEQPPYDFWIGVGGGFGGAFSKNHDAVGHYMVVKDSSSAWSFLRANEPSLNAQIGLGFFDFIAIELGGNYSYHKVKLANDAFSQENYAILDHWGYHNIEAMLSLQFSANFHPHRLWHLKPYFGISYLYSFYLEDISKVPESELISPDALRNYEERFRFKNPHNGGALSLGNRVIFAEMLGLDLRTGFAVRGRSADAEGNDVPTVVGETTFSWFVQAALEWHLRWR
jgi:hypothetical protein